MYSGKDKPTIAILSTYPPRECGIATFTQDLLQSSQKFLGTSINCKVAAINISPLETYKYPYEVAWEIDQDNKNDYLDLAKIFNADEQITGIIIQHEYGIFGGPEGENLLYFMKNCKKPILVTLHTTLPEPNLKMKSVTTEIISLASTIVVLTNKSKDIIENLYPDSHKKMFVIPHGIHPVIFSDAKRCKIKLELENHIVLTTFGLLSRGKGIEYALRALPSVVKKYPTILYLILGETHPVIRRHEGEKYRIELVKLINKLKLENHVKFYNQYFSLADLLEFLKATDIYIATSINPNQTVSGTLSYALGSGLAVISTKFAQAKEIITHDIGRLVPIKNSPAFSDAILDLLNDEYRLEQMRLNSYKMTREMLWSNVAERYAKLLTRVIIPDIKLDHLYKMTDDFGLFQFASFDIPNKNYGYTLDDNSRAIIVCSWLLKQKYTKRLDLLLRLYLKFIKKCQLTDGSFVNYIEFNYKNPTLQNNIEDLEDTQARTLWALSEIISNNILDENIRNEAKKIFLLNIKQEKRFTHLRAMAFAIKSFALVSNIFPEEYNLLSTRIKEYGDYLLIALKNNSIKSWIWLEDGLKYNNALLSESLIIAGDITKNSNYTNKGLMSLKFLISKTFSKTYIPIGHSKWYKNKQKRSNYDQQPEDPASMILTLSRAYKITGDDKYKKLANKCFGWFLGINSVNKSLYNYKSGGCYDGLHFDRVNLNQGAESLISYLMSNIIITEINK